MIHVTWYGAVQFCEWLTEEVKKTESPLKVRLPSEAEWELAARGGEKGSGLSFAGGKKLKELGWYSQNSHGGTRPVGLLLPNEFGLYDLSGNVYEWCESRYGTDSESQVVRGGSWYYTDYLCRVSARYRYDPVNWFNNLGFRVAGY